MSFEKLRQESSVAREHKIFYAMVNLVRNAGIEGIKEGHIVLKAGIAITQWQFYKPILKDVDEIRYSKKERRFYWDAQN